MDSASLKPRAGVLGPQQRPAPTTSTRLPQALQLIPSQVIWYLAPSKPGRLGGWKLRASSRWAQPLWWVISQRCRLLSSNRVRRRPWWMSRDRDRARRELGRAQRLGQPRRGEAHLARQEVHLGDSGCVPVQAGKLHTRCTIAECRGQGQK